MFVSFARFNLGDSRRGNVIALGDFSLRENAFPRHLPHFDNLLISQYSVLSTVLIAQFRSALRREQLVLMLAQLLAVFGAKFHTLASFANLLLRTFGMLAAAALAAVRSVNQVHSLSLEGLNPKSFSFLPGLLINNFDDAHDRTLSLLHQFENPPEQMGIPEFGIGEMATVPTFKVIRFANVASFIRRWINQHVDINGLAHEVVSYWPYIRGCGKAIGLAVQSAHDFRPIPPENYTSRLLGVQPHGARITP
jgi:hypothetical protein